jgi:hypothetical protein
VFRLGGMLYVVAIAFDALVDDCVLGTVVETTAGLCLCGRAQKHRAHSGSSFDFRWDHYYLVLGRYSVQRLLPHAFG